MGVARAHFVGHSMGTIVCQHLAATQPSLVASLTLFGALAEPAEATRQGLANRARARALGRHCRYRRPDRRQRDLRPHPGRHRRPRSPSCASRSPRQEPECYARTCEALAKATAVDPRRISAPTLLITGDADTVNPPVSARRLPTGSRAPYSRSLDRCGHWATVESPRESSQKLADFLRRALGEDCIGRELGSAVGRLVHGRRQLERQRIGQHALHQCPRARRDRRISLHRRGAGAGQPHQADHQGLVALRVASSSAYRRRRHGHRRHGRDADAGHDRRATCICPGTTPPASTPSR